MLGFVLLLSMMTWLGSVVATRTRKPTLLTVAVSEWADVVLVVSVAVLLLGESWPWKWRKISNLIQALLYTDMT